MYYANWSDISIANLGVHEAYAHACVSPSIL